jgi:hypothetical protein
LQVEGLVFILFAVLFAKLNSSINQVLDGLPRAFWIRLGFYELSNMQDDEATNPMNSTEDENPRKVVRPFDRPSLSDEDADDFDEGHLMYAPLGGSSRCIP